MISRAILFAALVACLAGMSTAVSKLTYTPHPTPSSALVVHKCGPANTPPACVIKHVRAAFHSLARLRPTFFCVPIARPALTAHASSIVASISGAIERRPVRPRGARGIVPLPRSGKL